MPTFRNCCAIAVLSLSAISFFTKGLSAPEAIKRPNILWLIAEDLGVELGCYGETQVWTPNIDRLAAEGVRYTRAYTTAPVCSPSRSALITGMYQITIGAHNHRSHRDDGFKLPEGVRLLTDRLRDAGFFTANVVEFPADAGFRGTGKTDWNFDYTGKPFDSDKWEDLKAHQPFYAQVNFQETHRPYHAPKRADPSKVIFPPYYPDHATTRADWAAYLDSATELDRKIGLIVQKMKQENLLENTVIVFFGDNGQSHVRGKQWCYESGLHVPLIIWWPKNFSLPKNFKPGTVDNRLVDGIDWTATTLDIAGVTKPASMQGRIFLGDHAESARAYSFGARDRCDETVFRFRTVRDPRYRYIRNFTADRPFLSPNEYKERSYPVWNLIKELHAAGKLTPVQEVLAAPRMAPEELYDLDQDPNEIHNLIDSQQHQRILQKLRSALDKWIEGCHDQGRIFEPPEVVSRKGMTKPEPNLQQKDKGSK